MKNKIINADKIKEILNSVIEEEILPVTKLNYNLKNKSASEIEHNIHSLRVTLKRIQALLYLMAPFVRKIEYQREKNNIVAARKLLGVTRDAVIRKATLENLLEHIDKKKVKVILKNILMVMQKRPIIYSQRAIQKAKKAIKQLILSFKQLKLTDHNINQLRLKLINSFYKSKKRIIKLDNYYSDNDLHRLRISSKKFYNELSYLKEIWSKTFNKKISQLDILQKKLGLVHDLVVTGDYLLSRGKYFDNIKSINIFVKCIDKRKNLLKKQSVKLAKKLFLAKHAILYNEIDKLIITSSHQGISGAVSLSPR